MKNHAKTSDMNGRQKFMKIPKKRYKFEGRYLLL